VVLLMGIASPRCGHPRIRGVTREQTPFLPVVPEPTPGTDDPSKETSSTGPTVDED
jgi:hypothetical protein